MKNTYQNGVLTPVNPKRYAYVYRGVLYSGLVKAYKVMIEKGPVLYIKKTELIENGQRLTFATGLFIDQLIIY